LVADAERPYSHFSERAVALGVVFLSLQVICAIHFDSQASRSAIEIHYKPRDHLLASEVQTLELIPAKRLPEQPLLRVMSRRNFRASSSFSGATD
jgi:hypothetical protein